MSRFVSAGTIDEDAGGDDDWERAKQQVEASRKKVEENNQQPETGKSLYEVLQANKAAKQEAFDEAHSLKNQFRSLDEDEADFLDSVLESTRAKDAEVRRETAEQLAVFRRQQDAAEKSAREAQEGQDNEEEQWKSSGRKRKKGREKDFIKGVKLRKSSSTETPHSHDVEDSPTDTVDTSSAVTPDLQRKISQETQNEVSKPAPQVTKAIETDKTMANKFSGGLGLGAYDSDDD